ncbi:MAG: hypothetical protein MUF29_09625 [Chitinophagaceae bacterium]|jgi:hypothetical protein|nr:hypothetical protein [Chitinophagaceae bacterium]
MKKTILLLPLLLAAAHTAFSQHADTVFSLGNQQVIFRQYGTPAQSDIRWLHVHENETTSVEAARALMDSLGTGSLVTWVHSGNRYVSYKLHGKDFKFDPNRIYTPEGLEATLRANGAWSRAGYRAAHKVANHFIKQYVDGNRLVVVLHNNSDSGGLHIRSYLPGGEYARDAAEVAVSDTEDMDDFFYTTDRRIYEYLKAKGFNILLQNNENVTNDGSLSVYCGYRNMAYLNIEAQLGHLQQQKRMMLAVYQMIEELFPAQPR